jgi:murein DD-endopeptidase MepM/ murein hydrolase activator NlpD
VKKDNKGSINNAPVASRSPREKLIATILWVIAGAMGVFMVVLVVINPPELPGTLAPSLIPTTEIVEPQITPTKSSTVLDTSYYPVKSVSRATNPHTEIEVAGRQEAVKYTVAEGDSLFGISKQFDIKPETVFWANYDTLNGSPDMIAPGIDLIIPPADGVYYQWKEGDTIQAVADQFYASANDILEAPINKLDLTNPEIKADTYIMVPGGKREAIQWFQGQIPRGSAGTLAKLFGDGGCDTSAGGAFGDGSFGWPLDGAVLIGNDYIPGVHQGIDLGSTSSVGIVAADSGLVVYAGWANGGYGNTVMIDHGNGFQTLYAHMSAILVSCGSSVGQGSGIGVVGSTGNSTGPHLHFEIRYMGMNDNPHNYLP